MPRRARGPVPAGVYHVWRRATGPIDMFKDDFDRTAFCNRLAISIRRYDWSCIAFVLMPTHFHLVVDVADDVLSLGMHDCWGPYAQQYNRRHGRSGHLRAEPYKHRPVQTDRGLRRVIRYVARNPVRAKLCVEPQDWAWGSYCGSAGYAKQFRFVNDELALRTIHEDVTKARELFRDIVDLRM